MKKLLDWKSHKVVNVLDDVSLWSAPYGRLLLENIPMKKNAKVVDIGFGTGFPLIELSQRFGEGSVIYGVDIWKEAIYRTKNKIEVFEISNVEILKGSATNIDIGDNDIDLVTSNLGVNNFEKKEKVYAEIYRILRPEGVLAITTNPIGTFEELFALFEETLDDLELVGEKEKLRNYLAHRSTEDQIIQEIEKCGLKLTKKKVEHTNMRFMSGASLLDHSLVRVGFREGWDQILGENDKTVFYERLCHKIDSAIEKWGEFKISIPMLYSEFRK